MLRRISNGQNKWRVHPQKKCLERGALRLNFGRSGIVATRLGLAGSTDLQIPVPQRDLSFVHRTFNNLKSCRLEIKAKSVLPED